MRRFALVCVALISLLHASGRGALAGPEKYPYKVVTTVGMVTDIVTRVAGDKAQVTGIIGAGVDPHLYKATRGDVVQLMQADVVFYSGLFLEGKMTDTLIKIGRSKPVTELINKELLLTPEGAQGHHDPHVWMDASLWARAVDAVVASLSSYDPPNAELYARNGEALREECTKLHAYGVKVIASIPESGRVLVTSHDAFGYFGRAYGMKVLGVQGLSTESEAGLKDINNLVDYIVRHRVKAVFIESSVSPKNIRAVIDGAKSRGHEVVIGGTLFSDAMGEAGTYEGTYIGMLDHNITTVARALGGEAPERGLNDKLSLRHDDK